VSDDGFKPYGWAPVPEDQIVLAEVLSAEGVNTNIVTDNLHLYRAFYDFQRGFDAFDYIRGQERDQYRPMMSVSDARVDAVTVSGNIPDMRDKARQYLANTSNRKTEEDWFAPKEFASAGHFVITEFSEVALVGSWPRASVRSSGKHREVVPLLAVLGETL
jgi:hypothetical protein